jgi:hypothetical protein
LEGHIMVRRRLTRAALVAATLTFAAGPSWAGHAGNGAAGGGFPQYRVRADADKGCPGDTVVWGSSEHKGIYYVDGVGPKRVGGLFACMAAVKKAGYQVVAS